jgi:DNA topoisomerase VI subunit B
MFATAACRTTDSLGSLNRYNYGIKNEWRFLNVVPLFDMFATAACRTTDSLGSPNRYNYGIKNEWRFLNVVPLFGMFAFGMPNDR